MKNALNISREQDFSAWYQEVVEKADLAENSASRGAMVVKPYGCAIWENIKTILNKKIKDQGVLNALFPSLIPIEFFEKEAEHISGFAKECVVITHHRIIEENGKLIPSGKLEKPYILRPTSETIIGESFSKWIKSYRDLPLKINQWGNVFRWEMRPRLFLRTTEFYWQEGHCAFANANDANLDAKNMLNVYNDFLQNDLSIYGINGEKTENEKFAGAVNTYTIESMMQDGKALQSCTSHNLGQNFAKAIKIKYIDDNQNEQYCWTSSWGLSTRIIGAIIMTHSDDNGLILPPKIAPYQLVIIPIIHNENDRTKVFEYCNKIKNSLKQYSVYIDNTYETPQNKKWNWIRKGAPIKIEVGVRDIEKDSIFLTLRHKLTEKYSLSFNEFINNVNSYLDEIQNTLFNKSKENLSNNIVYLNSIKEIEEFLNSKEKNQFLNIPYELFNNETLNNIMQEHFLSYRCIPFSEKDRVIIAKSY